MAKVVSRWPLVAKAGFDSRPAHVLNEVVLGQGFFFPSSPSVSPRQYYFINAPYSHLLVSYRQSDLNC